MTEIEAIKDIRESVLPCVGGKSLVVAIKALEKQIAKKPKERDCIGFNTLVCPVCKEALYLYEPYCDNCGQVIDWSDEE